jgi:hypothetical protein
MTADIPKHGSPTASALGRWSGGPAFIVLALVCVAFGLARRPLFGLNDALWLDETYTGAIAIGGSLSGLLDDTLHEVSPPVYYVLMWGWEKLFGAGNIALRMPSLLFSLAAPLLILWKGHPDRTTRLLWAALAALWVPGFHYAVEARSYALLFLTGVAQIILFFRMLERPSLKNGFLWCGISSLFALTHYHSLLVTALQGIFYLIICGRAALRTWPAALLFLPVLGWIAVHLPLVLRFASPTYAWQTLLGLEEVLVLPSRLIGVPYAYVGLAAVLILVAGLLLEVTLNARGRPGLRPSTAELAVVLASIASIAIVVAFGFLRPNFVFRYLIPFVPGLLLGLALWIATLSSRFPGFSFLALLPLLGIAAWQTYHHGRDLAVRQNMSWEKASAQLAENGARRLIFTWDNPMAALHPTLLPKVGRFFFDRDHGRIPVQAVNLFQGSDRDPNRVLVAAANRPGDALIWVFDKNVPRTRASSFPPAPSEMEPDLRCRSYGLGVVACLRPTTAARPAVLGSGSRGVAAASAIDGSR